MADTRPHPSHIANPQARRQEVEWRLARASHDEARALLLQALDDPYPPNRLGFASALSELLDEETERAIIAALQDSATSETRSVALSRTLRGGKLPQSFMLLLELAEDPRADIRYQALVSAYARRPDDPALRARARHTLHDPDAELVAISAQILAQSEDEQTLDALIKALSVAPSSTKLHIAIAIAECAAAQDLTERARQAHILPLLLSGVTQETTSAASARALVMLDARESIPLLTRSLGRWLLHPILKVEIAGALARLGAPEGTAYLRRAMAGARKDARGWAIEVCGRHQLLGFLEGIIQLAMTEDYHADTAIFALAHYDHEAADEALRELSTSHPDAELRELAARALSEDVESLRFT